MEVEVEEELPAAARPRAGAARRVALRSESDALEFSDADLFLDWFIATHGKAAARERDNLLTFHSSKLRPCPALTDLKKPLRQRLAVAPGR